MTFIRQVVARMLPSGRGRGTWNKVIDSTVAPVPYDAVHLVRKSKLSATSVEISRWLEKGGLSQFVKDGWHEKKGLEFFFSSRALTVSGEEVVLDAAGGRSGYLEALKGNGHRGKRYLNDHIFDGTSLRNDGVTVVGGDVAKMHLEDESVDKIACHHAFEHFQGSKDTEFIREAARILKPGGALAITPLFLADHFAECWNIRRQDTFDPEALLIIDETGSLPGGDDDGHFARIYDEASLVRRVIGPATEEGMNAEMMECEVDGVAIPDMNNCFGSVLNRPLRILLMRK